MSRAPSNTHATDAHQPAATMPRPLARPTLGHSRDRDPYPGYDELRSLGPIVWDEGLNGWLVLSHEHCVFVERNEELFSAGYAHHPGADEVRGRRNLVMIEGKEHRRLHRFFDEVISPKVVESRRPALRRIIHRRIDSFAERDRVELEEAFASRVPISAVAELLGLDPDDESLLRQCREWMDSMLAWFETSGEVPEFVEAAREAIRRIEAVLVPVVLERRDEPREDIISRLWEFGPTLYPDWDEHDIVDQCKTVFQAGSVTTQDLICSVTYQVLADPGVRARIDSGDASLPLLVEETLRRENPVQFRMRVARQDVEIGGVTIRRGERVWAVNAAANRDPARYECPHALDLDRKAIYSHLAFNVGPRLCVGRHLARVEAAEAVGALLDRLPNLRLDPDEEPAAFRGLMFRAYKPLHVRFDPSD